MRYVSSVEQVLIERVMQQGMQQGRQEGEKKGEALALQRLLTKRFGIISSDMTAKIAGASTGQIELWLDQVLDAHSLDDLFGSMNH
jgi:flagellar biosynthesis/type III secretory pathway protein FliH